MLGSVRGRLTLLTIALVLTAALAATLLIVDAYRSHRASTERQISETAGAMSLAIDGKAREVTGVLQVLALSPHLKAGDLAAFESQARRAVPHDDKWVVVADLDGQQLVNTLAKPGEPLPRMRLPADIDLRERETYVSDLLQGMVEKGRVIAFATLAEGPGGRPYILAIAMRPSAPNAVIAEQRLPPGWYGTLVDRKGVVIARNVEAERFEGVSASPDILERIRKSPEGVGDSVSLDGRETLVAHRRSPVTGWTFLVGVPRAEVSGSLSRSLIMTFVLCLALLALGALLTVWFARGVTRAVESLEGAAEAMGRGGAAPRLATGLRETDAVAEALHGASLKLKAREAELRQLNDTLEARVVERSRELEETTERLVQARKVEALGRLTGGVAHDFNNLLTAVIGNLDLLGKRIKDEALEKYVANARQAAQRGAKLTAQLLAFARRQRLEPEPLDVNAVIEGLRVLFDSALGGATRVRAELSPDPLWAMADRTQLELVVLNLAINARDAMPEGGEVLIETARERVSGPDPRLEAPAPGDYVRITVADTGSGMTPEVLARIWEPFFTTKPVGAGSGLGLPQVLGVVKQLGGGIRVDTAPGCGARFHVYLPVAAPAEKAHPEPVEAAPVDFAGLKVLLVDDDRDVRSATADLLRDLGSEPEEAVDAADALARLDAGAEPRLVIMDHAMPGLTGAEAAQRIRVSHPALPVLLISGYMDAEAVARTWAGPVLAKPFDKQQLAARIAAALQAAQTGGD
ncbi:ATP-binding protein [Caulobacter sp. 17J65-9]|uniref:hybrid sensor histidine kinase/response regulator n=1 Tax=Caulobacter sp. 17J65-9 TaxID=2709382 RepID=UPI0013CD7758|nr:ATP-binding protein [Caulobacter sp. 17J65-9]NEX91669.1 response regulator [Caulobacter sp. 17J65-9]